MKTTTGSLQTHMARHVKAQRGEEIRRFVLELVSFSELKSTVQGIFGIPQNTEISVKWMDDEGDWVSVCVLFILVGWRGIGVLRWC